MNDISSKTSELILPPVVRFAPSPTGKIHIGNARTALFNWLYAKKNNGSFILRFDDTDKARSKQEYADQILVDLRWLGIEPDRIEKQSERFASYDKAADQLRAAGLLYPCYETAEELERKRKRLLARGLPPVYSRDALKLSKEEKATLEAEGRQPHWRFMLPNHVKDDVFNLCKTNVKWLDLVRGEQTVDLASMSDPVLIRGDGTYLYTLPSCVDDMEMGVTCIIRGDDHVTNTAAQIALFEALGGHAPSFGHHNLLTDAEGGGLSKRLGSLSIESLQNDGYEAMSVASLATMIGTSDAVQAMPDMAALQEVFEPGKSTKSAAKFAISELDALNAKLVHDLEFTAISKRLDSLGIAGDLAEKFWYAVRGNISRVNEAAKWWPIVSSHVQPLIDAEDIDFIAQALLCLPAGDITHETWGLWTSTLKEKTGRKGRALFMPLRKALTGLDFGPEVGPLLPLIGREKIEARLRG